MKSIDYKIAKSEAEWLRNKYENMGVRESTKRLCRAVKRRVLKRINCVVRSIHPGMKRAVFIPSFDEKKDNIVVSLTSTGSRIKYIFPTLYSLAAQTRKPDLIVLWLGNDVAYQQQTISKIEAMGIMIKYREDLGPNTKYYYAFSEYKKDLVITVDDDIIYHEEMIEELYGTYSKYPDLVIARRVNKLRFGSDKALVKYMDWIWEYRNSDKPAHDLLATGVGGVLYPPVVMALKCWENKDFLRVSPKSDDIWLKFCELSNGIKVCAVDNSSYYYDVINHKGQKTRLSADNVDRGKNDERIRSCAEYFGMSDDLCERVLAEDR